VIAIPPRVFADDESVAGDIATVYGAQRRFSQKSRIALDFTVIQSVHGRKTRNAAGASDFGSLETSKGK
jgi:hypothetical protein